MNYQAQYLLFCFGGLVFMGFFWSAKSSCHLSVHFQAISLQSITTSVPILISSPVRAN